MISGPQLKIEIKRRGYTLRHVAAQLGIKEQSFGQMLKNDTVKKSTFEGIAKVLGVSASELNNAGDTITAKDHSMALKGSNTCDPRLLDIIQARDRQLEKFQEQLDKSQQHIDRLLSIVETMKGK
jgi:transcriptional regulator with XRE-family HTH domain